MGASASFAEASVAKTRIGAVHPGETVLDVLQRERIGVRATCGGAGTCGRCQVLVRDGEGLRRCLACKTPAVAGTDVFVERTGAMKVEEGGVARAFPADVGMTGYGMAADIGTTTLVAHLHDLESGERLATAACANPQIVFGADVISRITASVEGKLALMTDMIRGALCELRASLCERAGVAENDVSRMAVAGNTVMEHIVAGLAPDSIGTSPFAADALFGEVRDVPGLGPCRFSRCVAGYVGGDVTAGMLACELDRGDVRLFLDLGTNGEMALAYGGRIVCCATAAGPVFEGANVRFGMPASPGAIERVMCTKRGVEVQVVGGVEPVGLCGTGLVDAAAAMLKLGVLDETGRICAADGLEGSAAAHVGRESGENVFYLTGDRSVFVTQSDVRSLQLAKAAMCAGVRTLCAVAGVRMSDVESLEMAGGFGTRLDRGSAAAIGLFPAELVPVAHAVGNAAGEGASALLVSSVAREREAAIAVKCDYLELSTSAVFNGFYIDEMGFEIQRRI